MDVEAKDILRAALDASVYLAPRNHGLSGDELEAVAKAAGLSVYQADTAIDGFDPLRRWEDDRYIAPEGGMLTGMLTGISAAFNLPRKPEYRDATAFQRVRLALQMNGPESRDVLVKRCASGAADEHAVEVAITVMVIDEILTETKDGKIAHAKGREDWILPSRQLAEWKTMSRPPEVRTDHALEIAYPLVRQILQRRNPAAHDRGEVPMSLLRIFISHSYADAELAKRLIHFIEAGLECPHGTIRCTSVQGYKLDGGDDGPDVLRANLKECPVVLGLLTKSSLESAYVLMELGAAWAFDKHAIPLLAPGIPFSKLPGPFKDIHALKLDDLADVAGLIATLAKWTLLPRTGNDAKVQATIGELATEVAKVAEEPPPVATAAVVDMPDDDIDMRLEGWLVRARNHSVKPIEFALIDAEAKVPVGSSSRRLANVVKSPWSIVKRSASLVTLHREPDRVLNVRDVRRI